MFTIADFANFLGYGRAAQVGTKSAGIVTITKTVRLNQPLTIPKSTRFDVNTGLKFFSIEQVEISESASFGPVGLTAQNPGAEYNIEANQTWASPQLGGIDVRNGLPFSGGKDSQPERPGYFPQRQKIGPQDDEMARVLTVATQKVRYMMGLNDDEDFPFEDPSVKQGTFLYGMFLIENFSSQVQNYSKPTLHSTSPQEQRIYRDRLYKPLMAQIHDLISHKCNYRRLVYDKDRKSA